MHGPSAAAITPVVLRRERHGARLRYMPGAREACDPPAQGRQIVERDQVGNRRKVRMTLKRAILLTLALPFPLGAQIRASEIGSMSQTIDGTVITMEYSRPRARGRDPLFGTKAVHWDETWTPGANWATTFHVNKPVKINGYPVAKGKYSVWMKVKEKGPWTFILEPDNHRYHMEPPDSSAKQIRIPVKT